MKPFFKKTYVLTLATTLILPSIFGPMNVLAEKPTFEKPLLTKAQMPSIEKIKETYELRQQSNCFRPWDAVFNTIKESNNVQVVGF